MLFTKYIQESRYNEMNRIESEIARLQQLLTDIQAATQTDLALEQMADSAIEQLAIAANNIMMRNPELRPYLREAALRILDSDLPVGLLDGSSPEPNQPSPVQPTNPSNNIGSNDSEDSGDDNNDTDPDPDNDPPTPPTPPSGGGSDNEEIETIQTVDVQVVSSASGNAASPNAATSNNSNNNILSTSTVPVTNHKNRRNRIPALPPATSEIVLVMPTTATGNDPLTRQQIVQLPKVVVERLAMEFGIVVRSQAGKRIPTALANEGVTWSAVKMVSQSLADELGVALRVITESQSGHDAAA